MTITSILKPLPIQDINDKQFFIPHYQRGYRWTEMQAVFVNIVVTHI